MKRLYTLFVFLLTTSLYAQTPTTVLEGITNLNAPMAIHGNDLYYVSDSDHVFKIDLTEANPTPQAVVSTDPTNYDSSFIYDLAFHENTLYLSVPNVISDHSLTDILKVDLTANTLTTERVTAFTVPSSPIAILGNDLYMATNGLIKLTDLTVESPTVEVVMTSLPEDHTNENFSDFIFDGNILYMTSRGESNNKGVFKVDVTSENPAYEKIVESGDVAGIALNGNSLYYDWQANKIQRIQDVNGGTLTGANLLSSGLDSVGQLAIHNNSLYIADPGVGKILKYPLTPFEAIYELDRPMAVHGDDLYYVSDKDHVYKIIDINADNPVTEAVVSFPREEPFNYILTSLAFHGDMLYVSESDATNGDIISRIDLTTDPPSIEEVYQTGSSALTPISFLGDYIYFIHDTSDNQIQLLRLDVTAPTSTAEIVLAPLSNSALDIAFHGNDLYLSPGGNDNNNIIRTNVTLESPMIETFSLSTTSTKNIVFQGNSLYYSTSNSIRMVQEVASELVDGELESRDFISEGLDNPQGLAIHNNHLYIADINLDEIIIHELPAPPPPVQIWDGQDLVFTKATGADWTQEANQDRITDNIWLTRQNNRPIYNYKWWQDTFNTDASGPDISFDFFGNGENSGSPTQTFTATGGTKGLRWAILDNTGATTDNWGGFSMYGTLGSSEHFYSFANVSQMVQALESDSETTVNSVVDNFTINITTNSEVNTNTSTGAPINLIGKKLGVWIEDENIYFTLTLNSWQAEGNGGVSYTRSTDGSLSTDKPETSSQIILAPNPVQDRMYVYGLDKPSTYRIYNLLGIEVSQGWLSDGGAVEVAPLPKGLYFLKLQNGNAIKFVKE